MSLTPVNCVYSPVVDRCLGTGVLNGVPITPHQAVQYVASNTYDYPLTRKKRVDAGLWVACAFAGPGGWIACGIEEANQAKRERELREKAEKDRENEKKSAEQVHINQHRLAFETSKDFASRLLEQIENMPWTKMAIQTRSNLREVDLKPVSLSEAAYSSSDGILTFEGYIRPTFDIGYSKDVYTSEIPSVMIDTEGLPVVTSSSDVLAKHVEFGGINAKAKITFRGVGMKGNVDVSPWLSNKDRWIGQSSFGSLKEKFYTDHNAASILTRIAKYKPKVAIHTKYFPLNKVTVETSYDYHLVDSDHTGLITSLPVVLSKVHSNGTLVGLFVTEYEGIVEGQVDNGTVLRGLSMGSVLDNTTTVARSMSECVDIQLRNSYKIVRYTKYNLLCSAVEQVYGGTTYVTRNMSMPDGIATTDTHYTENKEEALMWLETGKCSLVYKRVSNIYTCQMASTNKDVVTVALL